MIAEEIAVVASVNLLSWTEQDVAPVPVKETPFVHPVNVLPNTSRLRQVSNWIAPLVDVLPLNVQL